MSALVVMAERCHWCSRQVGPSDLINISTGQRMCPRCHEWHAHALDVLAGTVPKGCQICEIPTETLNNSHNLPTTRMYVINIDGIYAVVCATCKEEYVRKRADLYAGTAFGKELNL
jgi:hypothetical protein